MVPDKKKDQHIMIDQNINKIIIDTASVNNNDDVLEIGGGPGNLTELLAKKAHFVYTVEKDKKYYDVLSGKFAGSDNVAVILGDILEIKLPRFNKIISNPPYQILEPFFLSLVKEGKQNFECCVITVPHRFEKAMMLNPDNPEFSMLSALFFAFYTIKEIATVPKEAFDPKPRVMSHLIEIKPKSDNGDLVCHILRNLFLKKEKKIRNVILDTLWNNGNKLIGRKVTKREAKEMIRRIDTGKITEILGKNASQLSNEDVRELSNSLLKIKSSE
jgi:16S rRNA (adenine1518-N6/adenine1519-N6)-dimethyltransferase